MFTEKQVIALLQFINPELLTIIHFDSPLIDETAIFLSNWNRGCRLGAEFKRAEDSAINLSSIEKILNLPSTFSRIKMFYRNKDGWNKEKLLTFYTLVKHPFTIRGQTSRRRKCIEIKWKDPKDPIEKLTEQIDGLSLQNGRSSEVLANPSIMKMIVKGFQCFDIQTLRKVSRGIRSCINHLKLDPQIRMYKVQRILDRKPIRMKRHADPCSEQDFPETFDIFLEPRNAKTRCISFRSRESLQIENDWHVDNYFYCGDQLIERVVNDFEINIRHQESTMDCLILDYDEKLFELIGNVLKSRETPLNVKYLRMIVKNQRDIMNILPYFGSVQSISIEFDSAGILSLNDVSKLDQWKNATDLSVRRVFDFLKTE
uniref:FTH domain-containing protein n=1 Tax=Caenorhabditis tropicalis TaxID=1561998 RepID=A0A1I7UDY3_9PELO